MRQLYKLIGGIAAVGLICSGVLPSSAQNASQALAERVPTGIHSVISGGFWTRGKDEGFFRVIVTAGGIEHIVHRLFIQWLQTNAKPQGYTLIRTVNVKELNFGHGGVLQVKTTFGDVNSFMINVIANRRNSKAKNFTITVKGDGIYIIESR